MLFGLGIKYLFKTPNAELGLSYRSTVAHNNAKQRDGKLLELPSDGSSLHFKEPEAEKQA